jgi:uncharacterized protein (DUF885 family)
MEGAIMTEAERLDAFFDEEWDHFLNEHPLFATRIGDLRHNDRLDDCSLASVDRRREHDHTALRRLDSIDRAKLTEAHRFNYDLYRYDLSLQIEGHSFPDHLMPITQLTGVQRSFPQIHRFAPFRTTGNYEEAIARLDQIPLAIDQTIDTLKEGLARQMTPPRITLGTVGDQIKSQLVSAAQDSLFYEPFAKFPEGINPSDRESLRRSAAVTIERKVVAAFRKLHTFWNEQYLPNTRESISISDLPDGRAWYEFNIRKETTTDLSPQKVHEIGLSEVARIRAEMDRVISDSGFSGNFEDFVHFLRTDPQFYFTRPEDLLSGYRDICKRADAELPRFFGNLPRLSYGVREIPAFSAPSQTTAYYEIGSLKAGLPGWYCANTYRLDTRPKWEMEPLSLHEAVPGHHLQLALAQELENVPKFRNFIQYTAYVEGWGLYSEALGAEMGFYQDPYSRFGQLTYDIWRAIRLVLDTGIHTMGWSRQKAIDYFTANSAKTENDIAVEVDRYIVWPGQALAYKIGELKIRELRKHAERELGDRFNIRDFHDRLLENGALPLPLLENHIKSYVNTRLL